MTEPEELRVLRTALEELDQKMTPYGDEAGEWVTAYIIPAAPWHRILALVRGSLWPEYVEERLPSPGCATCAARARHYPSWRVTIDDRDNVNCADCGTTLRVIDA